MINKKFLEMTIDQGFGDIAKVLKKSASKQHSQLTGKQLCPSASITEKSAHILGILTKNLEIHYVKDSIPVNNELKDILKKQPNLEGYFRFTAKCRHCKQWQNNRCNVAYFANKIADSTESIPHCRIKKNCRWFIQEGVSVCRSCKFIVR